MRAEGFFYSAGDYVWFKERSTDKSFVVAHCKNRKKRKKLASDFNQQIEASLSDREKQFMEIVQ